MKKIILLIAVIAFGTAVCSAQTSYGIFHVKDGTCTLEKEVNASQTASVWWTKTKLAILNGVNSTSVLEEQANNHLKIACVKNVKSAYNPFAGLFTSDLSFNITIDATENGATYSISDLMIKESYAGYGQKNTIYDLSERILTFENKKAELENLKASISCKPSKDQKKSMKDLEDDIEDLDEVLVRCDSELVEILQKVEAAIVQ